MTLAATPVGYFFSDDLESGLAGLGSADVDADLASEADLAVFPDFESDFESDFVSDPESDFFLSASASFLYDSLR